MSDEDILAFASFPTQHRRQIWSTNPMERVNKEIKRRTDIVGVFPNPAALLRLAGAVLVEHRDKWEAGDRRYLSDAPMTALYATTDRIKEVTHPSQNSTLHIQHRTDPHGVEKLHHTAGRHRDR